MKEKNYHNYRIAHDLYFNVVFSGRSNEYVVRCKRLFYVRLEYYGRISRYHFYNRLIDVITLVQ